MTSSNFLGLHKVSRPESDTTRYPLSTSLGEKVVVFRKMSTRMWMLERPRWRERYSRWERTKELSPHDHAEFVMMVIGSEAGLYQKRSAFIETDTCLFVPLDVRQKFIFQNFTYKWSYGLHFENKLWVMVQLWTRENKLLILFLCIVVFKYFTEKILLVNSISPGII